MLNMFCHLRAKLYLDESKRALFKKYTTKYCCSQFRQQWKSDIEESSKCLNYKIFKTEH